MKKNNFKTSQGSVIVFAILVLSVVMAISMTLAKIFIPKIKSASETINSGVAIFGANSLSEVCLYEARQQPASPIDRSTVVPAGLIYKIASLSLTEVDISDDCRPLGTGEFIFRATAEYRGVSRALEITQ